MSNRVRVCIITSVHKALDTRIFYKQAKSLVKGGYDVTLIAQHDKNEVVDGIKIMALPEPKNRFWRMLRIFGVFKLSFKQKADIYHFHDPELLPVGLFLKLLKKTRVIYDVHEDYPKDILTKYWLPSIVRKHVSSIFNITEKLISRWLDFVIVATDGIYAEFKKGKLATIANYPVLEDIKPKFKYNSQSFSVIYAGLLTEIRGISEIVQAMEFVNPLKNVRLIMYGKFDQGCYEDKIRQLAGFEKVEYCGWISPVKAWGKIVQADAGIVCFRPEEQHLVAMPIKLFEYMAASLPVIASNFPLWKKIVEGNNCGITVNPLNPVEIARAIDYLVEHPEEARQMGENGRKTVLEKYNWAIEEKKLLAIYKGLLMEG